MIGHRDLHTTAANPNFEMGTLYVRQDSAANVALLDVPRRSGIAITRVWMRVTNCDGVTADYDAVRTGTMWVVDVPGTHFATPGEVPGGVDVWASGDGADGEPYAWSIGTGSLCVREGDSGTPVPGDPWTAIKLRETVPDNPVYGDAKIDGGALYVWDGTRWVGGGGGIVDPTLDPTSSNAVANSAVCGGLDARLSKSGGTMTGEITMSRGNAVVFGDANGPAVYTRNGTTLEADTRGTTGAVALLSDIPTVPTAYTSSPEKDGAASAGTPGTYACGNHRHPTDTSRQASITASGILKGNGSGGVSAAVAGTDYQSPLTIDATPTASSTNPVQSGGVKTALDGKLSTAGATRSVTAEDSGGTETYKFVGTGEVGGANAVARIKELPYADLGEAEEMLVGVYGVETRGVTRHTVASGETTATFGFTEPPTDRSLDALLDIDNSGNSSDFALEFYGLGTDFALVCDKDSDLAELTVVEKQTRARFFVTQTAFVTSGGLPVLSIQRLPLGAFATTITRS